MPHDPHAPIVVLTGAGISAESGLATFRASDGLWENHRIEDVATPEGFRRNPERVHRFYNERRRKLREVEPNAAHRALAKLEAHWPGGVLLVTQNVDDLHDRAGSRNLIHMHGELLKARCLDCGSVTAWPEDLGAQSRCPGCGKIGYMRPHIVWFGEMPLEMDFIYGALDRCRLFAAIGTSGHVYPAAGLVEAVRSGVPTLEINLEPSSIANLFEEHRQGKAGEEVPRWVDAVLAGL